jgi:preprotein translocase subunit SecB
MPDPATDATVAPASLRGVPITVTAQYLKDLSFESPGSPGTIGVATELRQGAVSVDVRVIPVSGPSYEIVLRVKIEATHEGKTIYLLELEYGGLVQVGEVPPEMVEPLLMIEGPRLLFPFARAIVMAVTRDGGFAPLLINPIDFAALYRDFKRKNRAVAAPGA